MATTQELKQMACAAIDARKQDLIAVSKEILANPESGFREVKTSRLVSSKFEEMGIQHQGGLALTVIKGRV